MQEKEIFEGLLTAYIDSSIDSNLAYKPQFIFNNHLKGQKLLSTLEEELSSCEEFSISVAFITEGGITPLKQIFKELEQKNVKGRILTTDYLNFSEPRALDELSRLSNIELRMYCTAEDVGFHTKGYIFRRDNLYRIIVGSSNMTQKAMTVNQEWNTRIVSTEQGEMAEQITSEFETLWNSKAVKPYNLVSDEYKTRYETERRQREVAKKEAVVSLDAYKLKPNDMQVGFISNLKELVGTGANKGLLISATGTGKTYASAFGIRDALQPEKKVLFIVHRREILKQAMASYRRVFGSSVKTALLTGMDKDFEAIEKADIVFAMVTMMSKEEIYKRFEKDEFSVICLDEVHHGTADSYQKIINYFEPEFMLGMTATPDRTDGGDVYELFDHNIVYEIRLQQALENNLLCPFHYFGIRDIAFDTVEDEDVTKRIKDGDLTLFNLLTREDRVKYIIKQASYYGYSGESVKGLMFCSSVKEAQKLSEKFNEHGLKTVALTGSNSSEERMEMIDRLVSDDREDYLDYILTVDIFNEGVDIPEINQVIMLRPTESAIVFVQQLGRGLRKADNKEYVVILDFIGNYNNNFLIPIALSGDRTYNKDNMRKYLMEGSKVIPGASSMHFDEISKQKIYSAIDKATTKGQFLKEKYYNLKNKLGRVPSALEFYKYGEIDPILFIEYKKASYYEYVRGVDKDADLPELNHSQTSTLNFIATQLINGKRIHELKILEMILNRENIAFEDIKDKILEYGIELRQADYNSSIRFLQKQFINSQGDKDKYGDLTILDKKGKPILFEKLVNSDNPEIMNNAFVSEMRDLVEYGIARNKEYYSHPDEDNLVLYQKYSRKDVCRLLNWERDDSSTMYGYRIKYGTCPIFVTYEKKDDISETTKYEDEFVDNQVFSWMTRSKVSESSPEAQQLINYKENGLKIYLFVKKSDGEGTDFYYMGKAKPIGHVETTINDNTGKPWPIMNFRLKLDTPVREDIYEYLVN